MRKNKKLELPKATAKIVHSDRGSIRERILDNTVKMNLVAENLKLYSINSNLEGRLRQIQELFSVILDGSVFDYQNIKSVAKR